MRTIATDRHGLEVLDYDTCLALVASQPVGRVGFVAAGVPVVLPVNHVVDRAVIAFRTAPGSKLDLAVMERPVAFEADHYDAADRSGWSVVVRGVARAVDDDATLARLEAHDLVPWADARERPHWVAVRADEVTGRRIVRAES